LKAALRFAKRAQRDWKRIGEVDRGRISGSLEGLRADPKTASLDTEPLEGAAPWQRLRVGGHRVIFRAFSADERRAYGVERGYVVDRVIDRRDLDRVVRTLR